MANTTVSVNGTVYHTATGLPLRLERQQHQSKARSAQGLHATTQKSRTLSRKYVHRSTPAAAQPAEATLQPKVQAQPVAAPVKPLITRSQSISRFAKQYNQAHQPAKKIINDIGPTSHPLVEKVEQRRSVPAAKQASYTPSQVLKNQAIAEAMAKTPAKSAKQARLPRQSWFKRAFSMASASLAILLLGGYLTYLNMPQLSTRVAASQAGINASYPAYKPSGYSLSGPVAFDNGSVSMKFAANAGPQTYTLSQTKSGWDSSAVLDNYVQPKSGSNYSTTTANGLTIFSFGNSAAWVNGGILYTISGDAPLSSQQIERIATSL
ncbi:MAG: hypothetical protein WAQ25_03550 [Candidatus Saccharimonas sp.]